jgi:hypothetical protein
MYSSTNPSFLWLGECKACEIPSLKDIMSFENIDPGLSGNVQKHNNKENSRLHTTLKCFNVWTLYLYYVTIY